MLVFWVRYNGIIWTSKSWDVWPTCATQKRWNKKYGKPMLAINRRNNVEMIFKNHEERYITISKEWRQKKSW